MINHFSSYRFYGMIPGLLAWTTIILMFVLSWLTPTAVAIFIILFDIYWLLKTLYLSFHLRATFSKMRKNLKINWLHKLTNDHRWSDVYHLVILPMCKEQYEVVRESFQALSKINYPKDKLIVVLSAEERAGQSAQEIIEKIQREFGDKFFKFLTTTHPANIPDEIPGKGSNQTWATKEVKKLIIDPLKIPYENILVSVFDADTQVLPDYFSSPDLCFFNLQTPSTFKFSAHSLIYQQYFSGAGLGPGDCSFFNFLAYDSAVATRTSNHFFFPFNAF